MQDETIDNPYSSAPSQPELESTPAQTTATAGLLFTDTMLYSVIKARRWILFLAICCLIVAVAFAIGILYNIVSSRSFFVLLVQLLMGAIVLVATIMLFRLYSAFGQVVVTKDKQQLAAAFRAQRFLFVFMAILFTLVVGFRIVQLAISIV